jgi:hypothetical protein
VVKRGSVARGSLCVLDDPPEPEDPEADAEEPDFDELCLLLEPPALDELF